MPPYQQRVVTERDDLREKADRLAAFFDTETYALLPDTEQGRLLRQLRHMNDYREDRRYAFLAHNPKLAE